MRHMKLQGKILAAILGTMTLVLALLIGYVAFQANRSTMKSAQDMVAGMALATANAIDAEVEVPLDTTRPGPWSWPSRPWTRRHREPGTRC